MNACENAPPKEPLIILENQELKAGILWGVGGRLVSLEHAGGDNLLLSDESRWYEPDSLRPEATPEAGFHNYDGVIIWPGPQSMWWSQQEVNPKRRQQKAIWPPDPYMVLAPYEILEQSAEHLVLQGPHSPVSGVRLIKTYRLEGSKLHFDVEMSNSSQQDRYWGIWSNARFPGRTTYRVPADSSELLRIQEARGADQLSLDWTLDKGGFRFETGGAFGDKKVQVSKAFLHPEQPGFLVKAGESRIRISFPFAAITEIHPEQGLIEVYQKLSADGRDELLELEHHSDYRALKPGERLRTTETWEFFNAENAPEAFDTF